MSCNCPISTGPPPYNNSADIATVATQGHLYIFLYEVYNRLDIVKHPLFIEQCETDT